MARPKKSPGSSDGLLKPRRAHRKSRNGCNACKKRHMKCDESWPICMNCRVSDRGSQCIYINTGLRSPSNTSSSSGATSPFDLFSFLPLSTSTSVAADSSVGSTLTPFSDTLGRGDLFDLNHFALYHHLLTNSSTITLTDPANAHTISHTIEYALESPYLMNQLLAVAALHLSKPPTAQQPYYQLATSLQTRALTLFNHARQQVSEETCIPMFLFSSFVGLHVLCETLQGPRESLGAVLDRFITYLSIHRGVRAVTKQSWGTIKKSKFGPLLQRIEDALPITNSDTEPTDILNRMIESNASSSSAVKYREAVYKLQQSFSLHKGVGGLSSRRLDAAIAFCLDVDDDYVHLLKQRQPEALVILAYFAVLLHWSREEWVIGDGGQYLIHSISHHLGSHWAEWLHWPNSILEGSS